MAAVSFPISFTELCKNIEEATTSSKIILNPELHAEPGLRKQTQLKPVLEAILKRIREEKPTDELSLKTLSSLHDSVSKYAEKVTLAQRLSSGGGGKPLPPLVEKIRENIKELQTKCLNEQRQCQTEQISVYPTLEKLTPKEFVDLIVVETCVFKASTFLSKTISEHLKYREMFLDDGNYLVFENNLVTSYPAPKYLEIEGALFYLQCRLCFMLNKQLLSDTDAGKRIIGKLLREGSLSPENDKIVQGLLLRAQWAEAVRLQKQRTGDFEAALHVLWSPGRQEDMGIILFTLCRLLSDIAKRLWKVKEKAEALPKTFSSNEAGIAAHKAIGQEEAQILRDFGSTCEAAAKKHHARALEWFPEYEKAYAKLLESSSSSQHHPKSKKSPGSSLPFIPFLKTGIFDDKSEFFPFLPKTIPSPQELRILLNPENHPSYISPIDTLSQECKAQTSQSAPLDKSDFLPESVFKQTKAKTPKGERHFSPPQRPRIEVQKLVSTMEQLTLSPPPPSAVSLPIPPSLPEPLAPQQQPVSALSSVNGLESPYPFHVGDGPNQDFHYEWRVSRWYEDPFRPFKVDPLYQHIPPTAQPQIVFQHTIALALIPVVLKCGRKFENKDYKGRIRYSYTLPCEIRWTDGSHRFTRGVVSIAREAKTNVFFHVFFANKEPWQLLKEYEQKGYFEAREEEPLEYVAENTDSGKQLPDDGSRIEKIDEYSVQVNDPKNNVQIKAFFGWDV